jgi:hypothetical protein
VWQLTSSRNGAPRHGMREQPLGFIENRVGRARLGQNGIGSGAFCPRHLNRTRLSGDNQNRHGSGRVVGAGADSACQSA